MQSVFGGAFNFNQNISSWNVSKVTSISSMFLRAYNFDQDISGWDVSSVTNMQLAFYKAENFNQDISSWDTSSVTEMAYMFREAASFNQDISGWDVSSVTDMASMFYFAVALSDDNKCAIHNSFDFNTNWPYDWESACPFQPETKNELKTAVDEWIADPDSANSTYGHISTWDTSLITDMSELFRDKTTFNDDISGWDTSSVTNMRSIFRDCLLYTSPSPRDRG